MQVLHLRGLAYGILVQEIASTLTLFLGKFHQELAVTMPRYLISLQALVILLLNFSLVMQLTHSTLLIADIELSSMEKLFSNIGTLKIYDKAMTPTNISR